MPARAALSAPNTSRDRPHAHSVSSHAGRGRRRRESVEWPSIPTYRRPHPPHSIEAEQSVLGALIIDNNAIDKVADLFKSEDFYNEGHRLIYEHINRLAVDSHPADAVTVSESLRAAGKLDYVGGLAYIGAIANAVPTAANIRRYAEIVRDCSVMRRLAGSPPTSPRPRSTRWARPASSCSTRPKARFSKSPNRATAASRIFFTVRPAAQAIDRVEGAFTDATT